MATLEKVLEGRLLPVSSGHGDIDLILPGITKAHGLALLAERLGIEPAEMIAFGDSGNDLEMLRYVGWGMAMANAQPAIKANAQKIVGGNQEQGVLQTLEELAANQWEVPAAWLEG